MIRRKTVQHSLNLDLTVPRFGPFDPLLPFLGASVADKLRPWLRGRPYLRKRGTRQEQVIPVALSSGQEIRLSFKQFGEWRFRNEEGCLVLSAPLSMRPWVDQHTRGASMTGLETVGDRIEVTLQVTAGSRRAVPLGRLGELGWEVVP